MRSGPDPFQVSGIMAGEGEMPLAERPAELQTGKAAASLLRNMEKSERS